MKPQWIVVFFLTFTPLSFSATWYVPDHFASIQGAINGSANGDTIIVRPGTYVENIDYGGKELVLKSEQGPYVTVIDGNQTGSVVGISMAQNQTPVLEGFTITNGSSTNGGGVYCYLYASPLIKNNIICANTADYGGGIYADTICEPEIRSNLIRDNTSQVGGGIFIGSLCIARIYGNQIEDNAASHFYFSGGGIYLRENQAGGAIEDNLIAGNHGDGPGGGICLHNYASVTLLNNMVVRNTTGGDGGGIFFSISWSIMVNNVVANNTADRYGGGIYCTYDSILEMTNCAIAENECAYSGGGMHIHNSDSTIENTIFWNNHALIASPPSDELFIGTQGYVSVVDLSYSDVRGGQANIFVDPGSTLNLGWGLINADPLFVDAANDDFHLTYNSPCRDTGDNTAVTEFYDFEGDPRIALGGTVDMGADEFYTHLYVTGDQTPGGDIQVKFVGLPGTSPVRLFIGLGGVRPTPLPTPYGDLWLLPPRLSIPLVSIPANGILTIPTTIPVSPSAPYNIPMQGLVGLNSDSLTNLCVLEVR